MESGADSSSNSSVGLANRQEPPLIAVVLLNYNGYDHLTYSLPSLLATDYARYRLIIVDNASTDNSRELAAAICPQASHIRNDVNLGWSGGNNVGIRRALRMNAAYIVLVNNDIRVDPRWLTYASAIMQQHPLIGILGFEIHEPAPNSSDRDAGFTKAMENFSEIALTCPEYVGGMAMMIRAGVSRNIGLIDEGFFAYGEENDYQIRARKAGYTVVAINVPIWHFGEGSFGRMPEYAAALQIRSNLRLLIKHQSLLRIAAAALRYCWNRWLDAPRTSQAPANSVERRLRYGSRTKNLMLLARGIAWNVRFLPATLSRARTDAQAAAVARSRLQQEGAAAVV